MLSEIVKSVKSYLGASVHQNIKIFNVAVRMNVLLIVEHNLIRNYKAQAE